MREKINYTIIIITCTINFDYVPYIYIAFDSYLHSEIVELYYSIFNATVSIHMIIDLENMPWILARTLHAHPFQ